jgi:hypothetical protein
MTEHEGNSGSKRAFLTSNAFSTLVGAVIGAIAVIIGGVQSTVASQVASNAQAQTQVEATRRAVYADFVTSASDVCSALAVRPYQAQQGNTAASDFAGKLTAVDMVAPQDVMDKAQKVNDYLTAALSRGPGGVPKGCDDSTFWPFVNDFVGVARDEIHY